MDKIGRQLTACARNYHVARFIEFIGILLILNKYLQQDSITGAYSVYPSLLPPWFNESVACVVGPGAAGRRCLAGAFVLQQWDW